jgi:hypothetical protein
METIKVNKDFDCIEMKNAIQTKIYSEIKDMSSEGILTYFNEPNKKRVFNRLKKKVMA